MVKSLIIIYGFMGAGKSYIGQIISRHYNANYYEGDESLIGFWGWLSKESWGQLINDRLIPDVEVQLHRCDRLVISQALYYEDHRQLICRYFSNYGVIVQLVQIETPNDHRKKQLLHRDYQWLGSLGNYLPLSILTVSEKVCHQLENCKKAYIFHNTDNHSQLKSEISQLLSQIREVHDLLSDAKAFRYLN